MTVIIHIVIVLIIIVQLFRIRDIKFNIYPYLFLVIAISYRLPCPWYW